MIKHKKYLLFLGFFIVIFLIVPFINQPLFSIAADANWKNIGKGNLNVMETSEGYVLYPIPANYVRGLHGVDVREFKIATNSAYKLTDNSVTPLEIKEKAVQLGNDIENISQINGLAFLRSKVNTQRINTGDIVTDSNEGLNLWLISNDGDFKPLLDNSNLNSLKKTLQDINSKNYLIWSSDPNVFNGGNLIAYLSNRTTITKGNGGTSVHVVNSDGTNDTKIISSEEYGSVRIIGAEKNVVAAHSPRNKSVIIANGLTREIQEFFIDGWPHSLSSNAKYIFFRKLDGSMVTQNMYILDLETGEENKLTGIPEGYFYNTGGAWSPDGKLFAFYANGENLIDDKLFYRDNNLLVIVDATTNKIKSYGKPPNNKALYPLGSIQWIGNSKVITYSVDDTTWMVNIK